MYIITVFLFLSHPSSLHNILRGFISATVSLAALLIIRGENHSPAAVYWAVRISGLASAASEARIANTARIVSAAMIS
jgi:hypothetical protein